MTAQSRILVDINIVLDVLARREPHFADSAAVWRLVERGHVDGLLAAQSFPTIFYLYTRQTSRQNAALALHLLLRVFDVAEVNKAVIETALGYGWADFEDALQMAAAERADCAYLVTRNPADFKLAAVPAIQPAEFLAIAGEWL